MSGRFVAWFVTVFVGMLALLGSVGFAISRVIVSQPRELYRGPAFEFDLAPGWSCQTEGTEDVCYPAGSKPHAAIAVIAIKRRNDQDNLQAYEDHLRQPQKAGDRSKEGGQLSEVRFVRRRTLGGREWVEGLHVGSEIANFHTYYLATATSHIGMLVTMSVHKDRATEYVDELAAMMSSLNTYQR